MFKLKALTLAICLLAAPLAFAKPEFLRVFRDAYKVSRNSTLWNARCLTCHELPGPPRRNPYGLDVEAALKQARSDVLTADILKKVENKDSDRDGFTNIAEIKAGTLPGDAKSKPSKAAMLETYGLSGLALVCFGAALGFRRKSQMFGCPNNTR